MLIYKITNKINNKCYIGQTIKTAEERWEEHKRHAFGTHQNDINKTLYQAIRKYGLENARATNGYYYGYLIENI